MLAHWLNSAFTTHFPHVLPGSRTLIRQLDGVLVPRSSILVKYDIQEAYSSIDIDAAITDCVVVAPAKYKGMI